MAVFGSRRWPANDAIRSAGPRRCGCVGLQVGRNDNVRRHYPAPLIAWPLGVYHLAVVSRMPTLAAASGKIPCTEPLP